MSKQIWKYEIPLKPGTPQLITMPQGAKVLCLQIQNGLPHVWVEIDRSFAPEDRVFVFLGTGWDLPHDGEYIGTVQIEGFVWHLYQPAQSQEPQA